jgi:hypothetical protein
MSDVVQQQPERREFRPRKNSGAGLNDSRGSGGGYCSSNIYENMHRTPVDFNREPSEKGQIRQSPPKQREPMRQNYDRSPEKDLNMM